MGADYQSSVVGGLIENAGPNAAENSVTSAVEATGDPRGMLICQEPHWRDEMKAALTVLLLAMSASATAQTADALYKQACGPLNAKFVVEQANGQPPTAPEPGKALVYFIQEEDGGSSFTTRVGLDGDWLGVLQRGSYIFASVAPGEHHACAATLNRKRREAKLLHFTLEAGKTYYYLVRGTAGGSGTGVFSTMEFGTADRDEALYLIATDPQSVAKPAP